MVSVGSYLLSAFLLVVLALSLGFSAVRLRRRLMPDWSGAPARLVEAIAATALLIWLSELLGLLQLLYSGVLVAASLVLSAALAWRVPQADEPPATGPAGQTAFRRQDPPARSSSCPSSWWESSPSCSPTGA